MAIPLKKTDESKGDNYFLEERIVFHNKILMFFFSVPHFEKSVGKSQQVQLRKVKIYLEQ